MRFLDVMPQGCLVQRENQWKNLLGEGSENGGQVTFVIQRALALAKQGHEVDIICRGYKRDNIEGPDPYIETHPENKNVRFIHIPTSAPDTTLKEDFYPYYPEFTARAIQWLKEYKEANNKEEYDVVCPHYIDGGFISLFLRNFLSKRSEKKIPIVWTDHSLGSEKIKKTWESLQKTHKDSSEFQKEFNTAAQNCRFFARLGFEAATCYLVDSIDTVSQAHMEAFENTYQVNSGKMSFIPGGFDPKIFYEKNFTDEQEKNEATAALLKESGMDDEHIKKACDGGTLLFGHGRLEPAKGVLKVIEAMEIILKKHPDTYFVWAGGGDLDKLDPETQVFLNKCQNYANERGYGDHVLFIGKQPQTKIAQWAQIASMGVYAASFGPFELAPLEVIATKLPLILSKKVGLAKILQDKIHTLHVNPNNATDITKKIMNYMQNPSLAKRHAKNGATLSHQDYTWEQVAQSFLSFVQEAIDVQQSRKNEPHSFNPLQDFGNPFSGKAIETLTESTGRTLTEEEQEVQKEMVRILAQGHMNTASLKQTIKPTKKKNYG